MVEEGPVADMLRASLFMGVTTGEVQTVKDALKAGASKNWTSTAHGGMSALMAACATGHDECAEVLLKAGAEFNMKDANLTTALMLAAHAGEVECVELLLNAGADLHCVNADGKDALALAKARGTGSRVIGRLPPSRRICCCRSICC